MKTLKFKPELCALLLSGEKTTTWRLFDDKDLQEGDELEFINKETLKVFGTGKIVKLKVKTLGGLTDADWAGHEKFSSEKEMYETYQGYYGETVGPDTEVKIINYSFVPKG
jgi:hypothetical protein